MGFEIHFEVKSKLGKIIRITKNYWNVLTTIKHPIVKSYEEEIKETLINPDKIRISKNDSKVFLHYKRYGKYYVCVLTKHLNGEGFIITAYLADKIKKGESLWQKK